MTREKVHLALEVGFLVIPTDWSIETAGGQPVAVPEVKPVPRKCREINGWELRERFLRLEHTEKAAVEFLQQVGVWDIVRSHNGKFKPHKSTMISGHFGSRLLQGQASSVPLDVLWGQQKWWHHLVGNPESLAEEFGRPDWNETDDIHRWRFAWMNDMFRMPLHVEWRHGFPFAVVETITGFEMLATTVHLDLLRGGKFRYCECCSLPFLVSSKHKKKFCSWNCAHVIASRNARERQRRAQN